MDLRLTECSVRIEGSRGIAIGVEPGQRKSCECSEPSEGNRGTSGRQEVTSSRVHSETKESTAPPRGGIVTARENSVI